MTMMMEMIAVTVTIIMWTVTTNGEMMTKILINDGGSDGCTLLSSRLYNEGKAFGS